MHVPLQLIFALLFVFMSNTVIHGGERPTLFVSILPQKFFVQRIGGDMFDVEVMVRPGASPATYEPKPSQMKKLGQSRIYFAIGVPFEQAWLDKISEVNGEMKVVHTEEGITRMAMASHHHEGEDEHEEQDGGGMDPHIWLAPSLVKMQATTICAALGEIFPENRPVFDANLQEFLKEIDALDRELRTTLQDLAGHEFMVFHPSWGYWAREYGLTQVPVEIEGKNPKPAQLQELINHALDEKITVIFAQPQFSSKSAAVIAREIGGEVVMIDPLAEEWIANLRKVAEAFSSALRR